MEDFVEIARFPSRLEAEALGHALDAYGIPFLVKSNDIGIFGPGMLSFTPEGSALLVPEDRIPEVQELLSCLVRPGEEELAPEDEEAPPGEGLPDIPPPSE